MRNGRVGDRIVFEREMGESGGAVVYIFATSTIYFFPARKQQIERVQIDMVGWVWLASFNGLCSFLYDVCRLQAGHASRARF